MEPKDNNKEPKDNKETTNEPYSPTNTPNPPQDIDPSQPPEKDNNNISDGKKKSKGDTKPPRSNLKESSNRRS